MEKKEALARMGGLSDAMRLKIVKLLSRNGELCACEPLKDFAITQGTLSHHMKNLGASRGSSPSEKRANDAVMPLTPKPFVRWPIIWALFAAPRRVNATVAAIANKVD